MSKIRLWVKALRPRTLPLSLSSTVFGAFLAASEGIINLRVTALCLITTLFLQLLSNLANDYGDSIHGADNIYREGPSRLVQSGSISPDEMRTAIIIFTILSAISGLLLIYKENLLLFIPLGLLAILAAITYTIGKKPYGYAGLGDISVYIFFGLVGVIGSYFLHAHRFSWDLILPATTSGLFAVGVLNVNNIRDINSDKLAGKKSIPVRIGPYKARIYHWILLSAAMISSVIFVVINYKSLWQFLFLLTLPLIIKSGLGIWKTYEPSEIDPYLKKTAIISLIFVLTFGVGNIIK